MILILICCFVTYFNKKLLSTTLDFHVILDGQFSNENISFSSSTCLSQISLYQVTFICFREFINVHFEMNCSDYSQKFHCTK
jgi:hypothetical protein